MKIPLILFAAFSFWLPSRLLSQQWERLVDLPRARGEHASFVHGDSIYVLGGIHDHKYGPYNIEKFDTNALKWQDLGPWLNHRHHVSAGSARHGDEIWICGGKPGDAQTGLKSVMVYNIEENSWRSGPDLPGVVWGAPAVVLGDSLHVIGGATGNHTTLNTHYVLDLTDEDAGWKTAAPLPRPVVHHAGVTFQGQIWIIAGEIEHAHTGDRNWVQIYDPLSDSWKMGPPLPINRSHLEWSTFVSGGMIWSINGVDSSKPDGYRGQDEVYVYDPGIGKWQHWGLLPHNFCSTGAKVVGDYLYIYGGGANDWFDGSLREVWRARID